MLNVSRRVRQSVVNLLLSGAAFAAAEAFNLQAKMSSGQDLKFYDEHSLDQQRFYNILCQLYGSNPDKYEVLVNRGALPEPRAVRCPNEFKRIFKRAINCWKNTGNSDLSIPGEPRKKIELLST